MMQATNDVIAAILPIGRLGVSGVALLIITIEAVSWLATDFAERAHDWPGRAWTSSLNTV
jgi:hypothetical protein